MVRDLYVDAGIVTGCDSGRRNLLGVQPILIPADDVSADELRLRLGAPSRSVLVNYWL
jgi:hypothetical protein